MREPIFVDREHWIYFNKGSVEFVVSGKICRDKSSFNGHIFKISRMKFKKIFQKWLMVKP